MSIYSDKLAHLLVIINCPYFVVPMCTREDALAHNLGVPYFDDIMSNNSLTTSIAHSRVLKYSSNEFGSGGENKSKLVWTRKNYKQYKCYEQKKIYAGIQIKPLFEYDPGTDYFQRINWYLQIQWSSKNQTTCCPVMYR